MSEYIRTISVSLGVDTNKQTRRRVLSPYEDESTEEFTTRVKATLEEMIDGE